MAKVRITLTNGSAPEDISDAIGKFLAQQGKEVEKTDDIEEIEEE